jgi:hypothetical protein
MPSEGLRIHPRHLHKVVEASQVRTCNQVFDEFIEHCEARLAKHDLAAATLTSYRKCLNRIWGPRIGTMTFLMCSLFSARQDRGSKQDMVQKDTQQLQLALLGLLPQRRWRHDEPESFKAGNTVRPSHRARRSDSPQVIGVSDW